MKYSILFFFLAISTNTFAQDMASHKGEKRVLMIFTPSLNSEEFQAQYEMFSTGASGFTERDLFIYNISEDNVFDQNGKTYGITASEKMRQDYNVKLDQYTVVLFGKDGTEKLRKQEAITLGELFGKIDTMPMRRAEQGTN